MRELPGVQLVAWSYGLPPDSASFSFGIWRSDNPNGPAPNLEVDHYNVAPDFFELYRIPLLRGRTFQPSDSDRAVVIGGRLASLLWPGQDPLGHSFRLEAQQFEVIGVARETHLPSLDPARDRPEFYQQFGGVGPYAMMSIRCAGPCPQTAVVRQRIMNGQPVVQVHEVRLVDAAFDTELARPRATAALGFAFAAIAIVAAAAGLFSVLSYTAARRRREFGIRTALGASGAQIRWLVLRDGLLVSSLGIAIGSGGAWLLARAIASLEYGVTMGDPISWAFVVALLGVTTVTAAWRPARAAARVDPVILLRDE